jgi:hypothetical protein
MLEIAPSSRPPLATLLAIAPPLLAIAALLMRRAPRVDRVRVLVGARSLAALLTAASAALWSRRHAGTGTETARGWPRVVHARWVSFEGGAAHAGPQWRGVAENGLVYTAAAGALLALGVALVRRRRIGTR